MSPTICVDQFVAAPPEKVWRLLTEPDLLRRWWAEGEVAAVVGHRFELDMPGFGKQPCKVLEVDPPRRFVYTFTAAWTLAWTLEPEGAGTRVFLEHSGFDRNDKRMADAFLRMGPGWRDVVLPRLAAAVTATADGAEKAAIGE
ncbi:SRPBCC domain-containing protein [Mycobacterium ulcerans]|uniref:SRPBCC family protein n=1 Tax=Mycobacterium ulcerans TaxID=1809 RepID=UPI0012DD7B25|nr:SRPBCC domain-containing protein [Mycobacterium ulcerans]MEB3971057.1 SRPBCC domain-containing protein [Mycobacterium ulcerans]MEB3979314.1 SRPBCC domain-containing protein [Mycobacterium ulcerans]MEB4008589.1 SRPBCC domain-containing protein [Mycobacterium ulcerans]MEB4418173.1 SRPBCC domain-containing protein [Mycobacterium ulcerans]MEB4436325.1 SRPBCC domain-containing protein [Mycobacterium ulcerans]